MSNNDVIKKLRVALQLRDEDIINILALVDFKISKSELGAFFRTEDHPNYRPMHDQILRNFLNGLVIHLRGPRSEKDAPTVVKKAAVSKERREIAPPKKSVSKPISVEKKSSPREDGKRPRMEKYTRNRDDKRHRDDRPRSEGEQRPTKGGEERPKRRF